MRLLSLTVRNYRIHREISVTFDRLRNLIGGPNESGKSTLAEAIHRALFLRAKTGGAIQREMVSSIHHGDPEVALRFEAGAIVWELEKRFAGAKGSTRLAGTGMTTLKDEEADAKLSQILKTESGGRANSIQLAATWSHLWVWQGSSGEDPTRHASTHKDTLVQRLQEDGIAAVMQSAADQRVRQRVAAVYDEFFTSSGRPKAGSKPEIAAAKLATAEQDVHRIQEIESRLEHAVADHSRAENEIAEVAFILPNLHEQRVAAEAKLIQVTELRGEEESRLRTLQAATTERERITKLDSKIDDLHQQVANARNALAPAEERLAVLAELEKTAGATVRNFEQQHRQAVDGVRQARLRHDLAAAILGALEKSQTHQRLGAIAAQAESVVRDLRETRSRLSKFPPLTATDLNTLRKLDRDASQATATLEAMATGIELLEAGSPVTLDGQSLTTGQSRILTDSAELHIDGGIRLRIHPGGGASLTEARALAESVRKNLADTLARFTVRDLDQATADFEQRQLLEQQIAQLETRWNTLGANSITIDLAAATTALESANAEVQRRSDALGDPCFPLPATTLAEASALVATLQENLNQAETLEAATRRGSEQNRSRHESATSTLQQHRDAIAAALQSLRDLETSIQVHEQTHGDAATRQTALADARSAEHQAADLLAATRQALASLAPESLSADLDRFKRAISQQENRRREAENLLLISRDRLTLDGSSDPQADLSHAHARREAARELHASELRRAQAIQLLQQLFSDSGEAIDRSLVQPLADRISGYLQCLFGPGAEVRVNLSDGGIQGLDLIRPGDSTFSFTTLSGGAKEQVAAAARLALAEILAADHDGCLPILFDDAFAFADPGRTQALQRMLDLAAVRGLQIIVLTCAPGDYSGFGAVETRIP